MGSGQAAKSALVNFDSSGAASRRFAGVAAAGRIVRELAEAGFAEARLLIPAGERLSAAAMGDVERLAGAMRIDILDSAERWAGDQTDVLRLQGNRLLPASRLRGASDGEAEALSPIRLDSPGASSEILRRTGKAADGPVSRWLNRPISRRISALLLLAPGVRPIHATAGTAVLAVAMIFALLSGGSTGLIAGGLLYQAASIFDGVDGEIARATFRTSPAGAVLDTVVDVATNFMFITGLAVNLSWSGHHHALPLFGWGFTMFASGLAMIAWRSSRSEGPFSLDLVKFDYLNRLPGRVMPAVLKFFTVITSRDFYALAATLWILVGLPMVILYAFAPVTTGWILVVIAGGRTVAPELAPRRI
jgi:CDP-L-myo-inositol myo-inositolphosphotransferase